MKKHNIKTRDTYDLPSILKIELTESEFIVHTGTQASATAQTTAYALLDTRLLLRGNVVNGQMQIEISNGNAPLPGPTHLHYVPVSKAYRFAGCHIEKFKPCGFPEHKNTFGLFFTGIGISDIEDIDEGGISAQTRACAPKQTVSDIFKLYDGDPQGGTSCTLELMLSDKFPNALQVKFQARPPKSGEAPRAFLRAKTE